MAKAFKVELYITDDNGFYETFQDILNDMERYMDDLIFAPFNVKESAEFEWDDDIDLNYNDCPQETYEKYFKG